MSSGFDGMPEALAQMMAEIRSEGAKRCKCGEEFYGAGEDCYGCHQAAIRRGAAGPMIRQHIPERYRTQGFDEYRCPPGDAGARDVVRAWGGGSGLMLWSKGKGTGKSHLAYALLRQRAAEGSIAALEWTDYLDQRKATMRGRGDEGLEERLRAMRTADLALIDDVGSGRMTEWALSELWALVNARYLSARPTVATANYSLPQLAQRLASAGDMEGAERIVSRLAEMCRPVEVKAQDYRLRGAR